MAIDFRTYTDPGVYIEAITPPVVFTAAIEPTILAIVGEAPMARAANESAVLSANETTDLSTLGIDPATINGVDRLLGTQYVSAAIGTLDASISSAATTMTVTTFTDVELEDPFTIMVEDEAILVSTGNEGTSQSWTVTRAQNGTTAAAHVAGQIVNTAEAYTDTESLDVGVIASPISATSTSLNVTETTGIQIVALTGFAGVDSFKLTYNGVETALITNGTNYTLAGLQTALENHADIVDVTVTSITDTSVLTTSGFIVRFLDPNVNVAQLSVTSVTGCTGAVSNRGVASDTFLDVEGERMHVTAATGSAPQTVTVVRGVSGTTAKNHGAVHVFENSGADFTVSIGTGEDALLVSADDTLTIGVLDDQRISDGSYVTFSFDVTDDAQFSPALFNDMDTVRDKFGDPLNSSGAVNSELSLGAQLAFANGATQLILVSANPDDSAPIQDAIDKLQLEQAVNVVAMLSDSGSDISYLRTHINQMANQGLLRRAFVGLDGVSTSVTSSDYITLAQQLNDERMTLVAPGAVKIDNGTSTNLVIPGYFATIGVAGLHAGLPPQEPLTRKQVFGFTGIANQDTQNNIFSMQAKGVLVVFEDRFGRLIIKHGLTTDMSTVYTREISVIAARDRLRDFILETLDGGQLIGSAMTSETPNLVMAAVNNALEEATRQDLINDYDEVKFRIPNTNPTLIEVRFSYKPTLPLNYIHVQFAIDTSASTVEFQSITDNPVETTV